VAAKKNPRYSYSLAKIGLDALVKLMVFYQASSLISHTSKNDSGRSGTLHSAYELYTPHFFYKHPKRSPDRRACNSACRPD